MNQNRMALKLKKQEQPVGTCHKYLNTSIFDLIPTNKVTLINKKYKRVHIKERVHVKVSIAIANKHII